MFIRTTCSNYLATKLENSFFDFELFNALLADGADVRHVTEVLVVVEGVADHELVRDLKGHVMRCVAITLK